MSELVNYSTGVTVSSAWLNHAQLREEGLASYVVYSVGGTVNAKSLLPAGTDYTGTDGVNGTTAISNAIVAMSAGQKILFRQGTYSITAQIPCAKDIIIELEQGATFKWTATAPVGNTAIFVNTASINLVWIGGTIDQNAVNNIFGIGFGSSIGTNPTFAMKSAVIRNLNIINVHNDGLLMNHVSNTDVKLVDVFVQKEATGTSADTVELAGTRCDCMRLKIDQTSVAASAITSAYLQDSVWDIEVVNSVGTLASPDIGLQSFTGPTSPFFQNVDLYPRSCSVVLNNGNIATGVVAGQKVRIHGRKATFWSIGSNGGGASGGGEIWKEITIDGQWLPRSTQGAMQFFGCNDAILDVEIDLTNVPVSAGLTAVILCSSTNAMDRTNKTLIVKHFLFKNIASGAFSYGFVANGGGGNKTLDNFIVLGGDVSQNNAAFGTAFTLASTTGTVYTSIRNVKGYNPQGWATTSPSVPASGTDQQNTTGYPVLVYITGLGSGVTAVGVTDPSGTLQSFTRTGEVGDYYWIDVNGKIRLTYTGSPTWKWYGL